MCILWELISEWIGPETLRRALQLAGMILALATICVLGLLAARSEIRIWRRIERDVTLRRDQQRITEGRSHLR